MLKAALFTCNWHWQCFKTITQQKFISFYFAIGAQNKAVSKISITFGYCVSRSEAFWRTKWKKSGTTWRPFSPAVVGIRKVRYNYQLLIRNKPKNDVNQQIAANKVYWSIDLFIQSLSHKSIHSCMHRGIHLIIYSLVRSIVLLLVSSSVVRNKYFLTRSLTFLRCFL